MIILAGLVHLCRGGTENLDPAHLLADTTTSPGSIALAFYSGLFSFAGWNYLNFVTEELRKPSRDLPRAIQLSLPLITLIYFLTNIAYFSVLSPTELLSSSAVAVTFGNKLFGVMRWVMPACVACSTFGAVNRDLYHIFAPITKTSDQLTVKEYESLGWYKCCKYENFLVG